MRPDTLWFQNVSLQNELLTQWHSVSNNKTLSLLSFSLGPSKPLFEFTLCVRVCVNAHTQVNSAAVSNDQELKCFYRHGGCYLTDWSNLTLTLFVTP